ncbi:MAG: succinic semialdehyde dehydrogenase [Gemmatimonadales bacterium]|jgi:succinate-semialdehyde dehydrogenase/glutarate-semialdehyde dehydrogenase
MSNYSPAPTDRLETGPASDRRSVDAAMLERITSRLAPVKEPGDTIAVELPFTGETLGEVPRAMPVDVDSAALRARVAQPGWAATPFGERARVFLRFHDLLLGQRDEALDLVQLETGKARAHAYEEVADAAVVARYYALHGEEHLKPRRRRGVIPGLTVAWEYRLPVGLAGLIVPWNYPLSLAISDSIPALLAGNAVLLKPDPKTPFTALWAVDLLYRAGLPADLLQVVVGDEATGSAVLEQADYLSFTGSTAVGRILAARAGERLIGFSLELGGKNPMVVLADADLDAAARGAVRGCFANTGQLCISSERLYVHSSIAEAFLERFVAATRSLRMGSALDFSMDIGSLTSREQLEKIEEHVRDAVAKGARLLAGGRARPEVGPYFFEPTILTDVTAEMELCDQETFGPVVSVYAFESVDEAIDGANSTPYGLNASVWTRNAAAGRRLARRIRAGTVNVNEAYAAAWGSVDAPMGGMKDSGVGRRHGAEGIQKFTESQTIAVQRGLPLAAPPWLGDERYSRVMTRVLRILKRTPGLR